MQTDWNIKD